MRETSLESPVTSTSIKIFFGLSGQKVFSLLAAFVISIVLARVLGPEDYGLYVFVSAFIPLAALPISGGLPQLLTREVAKYAHRQSYAELKGTVITALRLNLWLSICLFCLCALGLLLSDGSSKLFLIFLALLCVPFIAIEATHNGIIKGFEKPAHAEFAKQVIQPVVTGALLLVLISSQHITASTAILSMILATASCALFSVLLYRRLRPPIPSDVIAVRGDGILFTSLASFSAIALITNFNAQIGILILGILDQNAEAASLRIAERAGQLVAMPLAIVNLMIAPRIVAAFQSQDVEQLRKVAQSAALYSFGLTLPATVALLFFGDWLIAISFGEAYVQSALPAVIIIAVGQTLGAFLGSVWPLLTMTGHEKRALGGLALAFALNVLVCLWLAPTMGATGAALGSAVSLVLCKFIFSREIKKLLNIRSRVF